MFILLCYRSDIVFIFYNTHILFIFFFQQKTAYEMRISDWSSDVCSADLGIQEALARIGGNAWLMDSARILTANAVDLGEKPSVLSAILKYHQIGRATCRERVGQYV